MRNTACLTLFAVILSNPTWADGATLPTEVSDHILGLWEEHASCDLIDAPLNKKQLSDSVWAVETPIGCSETGLWDWGGAAGPNTYLAFDDVNYWSVATLYQTRGVDMEGSNFRVARHSAFCPQASDKVDTCLTVYNRRKLNLVPIDANYPLYEAGPEGWIDLQHVKTENSADESGDEFTRKYGHSIGDKA